MGLALAAQKVFTALKPQVEHRRRPERLLVVDDEHMACSMISLRLRQNGFHVETAASGAEALDILGGRNFDLVLLDRLMPGWTGDRVLQELRLSHSSSELPVIMVSALDDSQQVAEALELGANDYITKPIDFTVAIARIRSQLGQKKSGAVAGKAPDQSGSAYRNEGDGLFDWNLETDEVHYSPRWGSMLGLDSQEISGDPGAWFSRVHPKDLRPLQSALRAHWAGKTDTFEMEYRIRCKDDSYRWMASRGVAFRDIKGKAVRMAGSQSDIHDRKTVDGVTGLPNRVQFAERLSSALEGKRLSPGLGLAVLVVHVDRLNLVNDGLGHQAADRLLMEFSQRIRGVLSKWRAVSEDRQNSCLARLGEDKFGAIIDGVSSPLQAVSIADQMLQALRPMLVVGRENGAEDMRAGNEDREFSCTASIGVALSKERYQAAEDIIEDANAAMSSAHAQEKSCWALFSDSMHLRPIDSRHMEVELREALEEHQFRILYQPRVELASERILGFEALIRWMHPSRGLMAPADFIPLAEQTGQICEIGFWVMEESCSQLSKWRQQFPSNSALDIAVNVSPVQLREPDFVGRVLEVLQRTGLAPTGLHIELTENVRVEDLDAAQQKLSELKKMGVGLKMDDFATGYSSLKYLTKLPFDTLKIDRSFVGQLDDERGITKEIVRTILNLATSLQMDVIAEGIEQPEDLKHLRELGCRYGQGFYFSEPVNAAAIERLLTLEAAGSKQSE